jgi:hypothetical protein
MTRYAVHLESRHADGRSASIWAVAPSADGAVALISAYRDAAGLDPAEITRDIGPMALAPAQAEAVGLDLTQGASGLFCLMRQAS